ncbi:MAG: efflux RND transporter periplasmic adaptor subunit [Anaerolineaceae bacterium]|nr:efflux RND transporter periplasmic adaptor subunit [Anaerolineaceae bacterium]
MKKRTIIILVVVAVLVIGGFFGFQYLQKQGQEKLASLYETEPLERGQLTAIVGTTGSVRSNQTAVLAWQTSGTIEEISVEVGEMVSKDQVMAILDKATLPQSVILAEADLVQARRALDFLLESEMSKAQAQLALAQAQDNLDNALDRRESKDYDRASEATLGTARANYILAQDQVDRLEEEWDGVSWKADDDTGRAAVLSALSAARTARDRSLANLNWLLGNPDEIEVAIADANMDVAQANLEDAKREWERLKDGPDPEDVESAEARVTALEALLRSSQMEAPFGGTVTDVNSKVGDQVTMGTVTFRIDDLSKLIVDVNISEVDIPRIKVGQEATITFDALANNEFIGLVTEVGRVGNSMQGSVEFEVSIELEAPSEDVLTGMTAAVNLVVEQIDDVLLVPNRAVRIRDGKRVVYVMKDGMPEKVVITISASSDITSAIEPGDIKEGDLIILNPPAEDFNFGPMGGPGMD